jgi:hypothetical protein
MEVLLIVLISILSVLSIVNFLILFYMAAFIVRLRGFVIEFLESLESEKYEDEDDTEADLSIPNVDVKPKTWDQKYEEELDMIERQIKKERGQSGLVELE